jgi:hypothetical protein
MNDGLQTYVQITQRFCHHLLGLVKALFAWMQVLMDRHRFCVMLKWLLPAPPIA